MSTWDPFLNRQIANIQRKAECFIRIMLFRLIAALQQNIWSLIDHLNLPRFQAWTNCYYIYHSCKLAVFSSSIVELYILKEWTLLELDLLRILILYFYFFYRCAYMDCSCYVCSVQGCSVYKTPRIWNMGRPVSNAQITPAAHVCLASYSN